MWIAKYLIGIAVLVSTSTACFAEVCDYRPSHLLGKNGSKVALGSATGAGAVGGISTAAGFYTLVHASSGLTMLGSTAAGASAAGTVGIIGGTAGVVGSTAAVVLNPLFWIPALVLGAGGSGYEAVCAYLVDERITDPDEVLKVMQDFQKHADKDYFNLVSGSLTPFIELKDQDGQKKSYKVADLYIVEGVLMHRDFGRNSTLGRIVFVPVAPEETELERTMVEAAFPAE
jgi:hypothetical protein